jgi:hypothetical protein
MHFPLSDTGSGTSDEREAIYSLEDVLRPAVPRAGGDHDGHEFGGGEAVTYTYGPNADTLFDIIRGCLGAIEILPGAYAIKRYGSATEDAREELVPLTASA